MGLTKAFVEMAFDDLSGLSLSGNPFVEVTDIYQKSTIEVWEWGVAASSSIACKFRL